MFTKRQPSWSIRCDFDTGLQFASFIGRHLTLDPSASSAFTQEEEAWHQWWSDILTNTMQQAMHTIERRVSPSTDEYYRALQAHLQTTFHPPNFPHLATAPDLQTVCCEQWFAFHQWWETKNGGKEHLSSQLSAQLHRINIQQLVARCSKGQQKKHPQPFQLIVEFVHWPCDYVNHLSETVLVVGSQYLETNRQVQFRERLTPIISHLV